MVPISRRQFVAAGGLTVLAGCLSRGADDGPGDDPDGGDGDLPGALSRALAPVPTSVEGDDVQLVRIAAPTADEDVPVSTVTAGMPSDLDLDPEAVDRTAATTFRNDLSDNVATAVGSFDAADVGDPEDAAVHATDGIALAASSDSGPWDAGLEAAREAREDPDVGLAAERSLERILGPVADRGQILWLPTLLAEDAPQDAVLDSEALESIAVGIDTDFEAREQRMTYAVLFAADAEPDEGTVESILETDGNGDVEDAGIEIDGRLATATLTQALSPYQLPDDSPDARFGLRYDAESGVVTLEQVGEESVDVANLELRIDEEPVEAPWDDEAEIEPGDTFELDAALLSTVEVRWIDPEREDVYQPLGRGVVGGNDVFEASYDREAEELTITYTGETTVDADQFELQRIGTEIEDRETEPLTDRTDALEPGEELVIEDHSLGEQVHLRVTFDRENGQFSQSVFWHRARPPGRFEFDDEDGTPALVYRGESERPASDYRVTVDGEPVDTQWADVHDALADGDRLEVDADTGSEVAVEYAGDDEPHEMTATTVRPRAEFEFALEGESVEITHAGGESIDAEALDVRIHGAESPVPDDAWADAYDTVEEGDSITVEFTPDAEEDADRSRPETVLVLYDGHLLDHRGFETGDD